MKPQTISVIDDICVGSGHCIHGDGMGPCRECAGTGIVRWCPKCGADYWLAEREAKRKAKREAAASPVPARPARTEGEGQT